MKVHNVQLENFSSYAKLEFDFTNQGLTLVQGPTGAGKSTLCDAIPWILFGKTSKGGAVDEVLSWPGDKVTKGTLHIEIAGRFTHIMRVRGPKAKDNDLYFMHNTAWDIPMNRGKDLPDTQRLINNLLGMDYETYLAGAYYHEFSRTAQFFKTDAKNRRQITEQLVDLSLATNLQAKASEVLKAKNKVLSQVQKDHLKSTLAGEQAEQAIDRAHIRAKNWDTDNQNKCTDLQAKFDKFEATRQSDLNEARRSIQVYKDLMEPEPSINLTPKCPTCGQDTESPELHKARHQKAINDKSVQKIEILSEKIKEIKLRVNPYKLSEVVGTGNPYTGEIYLLEGELEQLIANNTIIEVEIDKINREVEDLELLQEVIADYRSSTIRNATQSLQDGTNTLLTNHFDAEIRVELSAQDADKLEVSITKDGNNCVFSQLSKGQRCILKFCFGATVMKAVANHKGLSFPQLFFDEALDGLDDTNKIKAFGLLQTLALDKESVFCVEHSEALKAMFENAYSVSLVNGVSQIEKG